MNRLLNVLMVATALVSGCQSTCDQAKCDKSNEPLRVLMIGNSFSISNMSQMPKVAKNLGLRLDLASMCIGGCSLQKHWSNCTNEVPNFAPYHFSRNNCGKESSMKQNLPAALAMEKWDVVTIQQCSHLSWKPESYQPYADNLINLIHKLAPQAKIYIQETWSYTPWDKRLAKWGIDQNEMYSKLKDAYAALAKQYDLPVIRMGTAVQEWRRRLPVKYTENSFGGDVCGGYDKPAKDHFKQNDQGKWQPAVDVFHLNARGTYFQALVWTAKLFDNDLSKLTYRRNVVTESEMKLMIEIAKEVK